MQSATIHRRPPKPGPDNAAALVPGDEADLDLYLSCLFIPWRMTAKGLTVATSDMRAANICRIRARYGDATVLFYLPRQQLIDAIRSRFRNVLVERSTSALKSARPEFSAEKTFTSLQIAILVSVPFLCALALFAVPYAAQLTLALLCMFAYLANGAFRAILVWMVAGDAPRAAAAIPAADDPDLPLYTILVPLYREGNVLPALVGALRGLAYRRDRLDIKLVLEADDCETIAAAQALELDDCFEILCVPPGQPRTKPKACNYALQFARGEFTVIFDAEDRPETDQLLKAVTAFRTAPPDIACLQAQLNFYNASENWLTCMFALDYALWFDFLLPGLERFGIPMPLGGTSNHFRTQALRAIHGWDPYNVTEDADIGIRLAQMGYRVATLNSTTFEEATNELGNWMRQRSRWLKGYMQTWLVHMRRPRALLRNAGLMGFLGFQLFIGGTILTTLLNPVLWIFSLLLLMPGMSGMPDLFGTFIPHASVLSLIIGNGLFTYLAMLGPYRRGWLSLSPFGLAAPFYWLLISFAAYRGAWQLVTKPWHWEKTRHGTTKMSAA